MRANFDLGGAEQDDEVFGGSPTTTTADYHLENGRGPPHKKKAPNGRVSYYFPTTEEEVNPHNPTHSSSSPAADPSKQYFSQDSFVAQVQRTLGRTSANTLIRRSRLIHLFYIVALPLYTLLGAYAFQQLDGDYDEVARANYTRRCTWERERAMNLTRGVGACILPPLINRENSTKSSGWGSKDSNSFRYTTPSDINKTIPSTISPEESKNNQTLSYEQCLREAIQALDACFRAGNYRNFPTHSMANFSHAVIYATSVYTTIGYGNIAADTDWCRAFTILYAVFGIPLFFAFLKDMGQLFSVFFMKIWRMVAKLHRRARKPQGDPSKNNQQQGGSSGQQAAGPPTIQTLVEASVLSAQMSLQIRKKIRHMSSTSGGGTHPEPIRRKHVREQRKVFTGAVIFFLIYLIGVSLLFQWLEPSWNFFTSFYFLFTSVALVGFGDVFPTRPNVVLIGFALIMLGIVLFGMCYFILQEEIREKAFQASRRVRNSIFRRTGNLGGFRKRSMSFETGKRIKLQEKEAAAAAAKARVCQADKKAIRVKADKQAIMSSSSNPASAIIGDAESTATNMTEFQQSTADRDVGGQAGFLNLPHNVTAAARRNSAPLPAKQPSEEFDMEMDPLSHTLRAT